MCGRKFLFHWGQVVRTSQELTGLPVIELCRGRKVGEVSGVLCDATDKKVYALLVHTGHLFRQKGYIRWSDIYSLGADAVTVQHLSAVKELTAATPAPSDSYLQKQVMTTSGQLLGRVEDITLDPKTGRIIGCVLTDGLMGDLLHGRSIIPLVDNAIINDEHMIVPDEPRGSEHDKKFTVSKLL